ncbi:MAG: epoxyqueuosine reductase QueH, partial [Caldiserica bacterium]|nr:epoxyqueuosine reductase QueH [Caldisericota bacterium]
MTNICSEILLHCCCGPCSLASIDFLVSRGFLVRPMFFNPNIEPDEERSKRLEAFLACCRIKHLEPIIIDEQSYIKDGARCSGCFEFRLEKAASVARSIRIALFTTSLLISPYQKHDLLANVGSKFDGFRYFDLRPFYADSQMQAKELGIYRQKYCGCFESHLASSILS